MSTLTARLRLKRHTTGDRFRIQDYTDNWNTLDASPGRFICTSDTRPLDWSASHNGRTILETDTGLHWWWDGTLLQFRREAAVGDLGMAQITANVQTSNTALQTAVSLPVTVPAGNRPVMVHVFGPGVYNNAGLTRLALFRGETQLESWLSHGRLTGTADDQPRAISISLRDTPPTGASTYTLRYSAEVGYGGTSTLQAALDSPLRLSVQEI